MDGAAEITGFTKRVTANSESEAADKIAKGWFDAD
jgi:hypothetical protein